MIKNLSVFCIAAACLAPCGSFAAEPKPSPEKTDLPTLFEFSDSAQMKFFQGSAYTQGANPGMGNKPGLLVNGNAGPQDLAFYFVGKSFNLTTQTVVQSVCFKADAGNEPGLARVFLGFGERLDVNLGGGDAKIGVRILKNDKPKYKEAPWIFQLVNGVATKEIGHQFVLEEGHWYQMRIALSPAGEGRKFTYEVSLQEYDTAGEKKLELERSLKGETQVLGSYNPQQMWAGILGQRNNGGAVAFDDWKIEAGGSDGAPGMQVLRDVVMLPTPLAPAEKAPANTIFGTCGHFMHTPLFYPDKDFSDYWEPKFTLPLVVRGNLGWVREPLYQPWFDDLTNSRAVANRKRVEEYLGVYQQHGLRVIITPIAVNSKDKHAAFRDGYFDWIADLCKTFDCVRVVEMHNEPNLKFFWGATAQDYAATYKRAAELIRAKDKEVSLAVGSLSSLWWQPGIDWLQLIIDEGALEWADAVAVHPYNTKRAPESDPNYTEGSINDSDHLEKAMEAFSRLVHSKAPAGKKLKLYFTELGYSSGESGMAALADEELQADYLSRLMLIYFGARLNGLPVEAICWYDFKNDGRSNHAESNFGLVSYNTSVLKPAYEAYRRIGECFASPADYQPVSLKIESSNWADCVKTYAWRRNDGLLVIPFWRMDQRQAENVDFDTDLSITLPKDFTPREVVLHSLQEQGPRSIGFEAGNGKLRVPLRVTKRAAWLEVKH